MELLYFNGNILDMFKKKIILVSIFILLLFFRITYSIYEFNYKYNEWKNIKKEITIISVDKIEEEKIRYIGLIGRDKVIFNVKDVDNIYNFGDKITVMSSYYKNELLGNPYEFNYNRYLNSKNIVLSINVTKVLSVKKSSNIIVKLRKSINDNLDNYLGKYNNIIKSLMYGDDSLLDEEFSNKCRNIGIGHMMCVSGTHVYFLLSSIEKITDKRGRVFAVLKIFILFYFYIISLFKLSLLRVIIMYIINLLFPKMKYYLRIVICMYVILIINPYYIFNIGIIFGFLSVISISVFNPVILSFLKIKCGIKSNYLLSNMSMSLSSLVLIIPFQIYYFEMICPICIISNICLCFLFSFLMQFIFYSFIFLLIPFISGLLLKVVYLLVNVFVFEVNVIDRINIFNISIPRINIWFFILYYLSLYIIMNKDKIAILYFWKIRKIAKWIMDTVVVLSFLYCITWYVYIMYFESYVIYFNVGQGNMCLIHKGKTNVVVDCGSTQKGSAAYIIETFFKAKNINTVDMFFVTHMHADHMNGIEDIISSGIIVKRVGYTKPYTNVCECEKLYSVLKDENIGIMYLTQEDNINIGGINVLALTPPKDSYFKDSDMLNANSTVFLVNYLNKRLLFMGDSTKVTEKYLEENYLDKIGDVDYYQVSHHGSKTSSIESFLKSIKISDAIISSKEAVYGHPDREVVELLNSLNINVYITEKRGAIIF